MAADPYKEKNKDEPGTKEKIEDLSAFIKSSKFGMMTTKEPGSDLLVSRAMAVAAQVRLSISSSASTLNTLPFPSTQCTALHPLTPGHPSLLPLPSFTQLSTALSNILNPQANQPPSFLPPTGRLGLTLLFHTNTQSGKTHDLSSDPHVNISFLTPSDGSWASISGHASIITSRSLVSKYYSPALKAWLGDLGDGTHDGSENDPRIGVIKVEARTVTYAVSKGTMVGRAVEVVKGAVTGEAASVNDLREISEDEIKQFRASLGGSA